MPQLVVSWRGLLMVAALALVSCEGRKSTPTGPTPSCTPSISPESRAFSDAGGPGTVTVSVEAGCTWTAASAAGWTVVTAGASGTGPGTVSYTVGDNAGPDERTTILTIAERRHTVTQAGRPPVSCSYELAPGEAQFTKDGGDGAFQVNAPAGCAWTAATADPWLALAGPTSGSGPGEVRFAVERNRQVEGRAGSITVADRTFAVRQAGDAGICQYEVAPVTWSPCMAAATLTATLTAPAGCPWTIRATAPWLTAGAASGEGSAAVALSVTENYDAPRDGVVEVRWPTPTAGQNIHVHQAGCRYAVSVAQIAMPAAGGTGTFNVIQQSDPTTCGGPTQDRCVWRAAADVDWIVVTTSGNRSGDDRVEFVAAANPGASARTGRIAVRDRVVTVTQAGR